MNTINATEAKLHFGELLDRVRREPISIIKNGRKVAAMLAFEDYEKLSNRLTELEDILLVLQAKEAGNEGFLGTVESEKWLKGN